MKLAVIGATGMVGSQVTAEALTRGHEVDAFSRSGRSMGDVQTQPLSLSDTQAVVEVIDGHDATLVSVANRDDYEAVVAAHRDLIAAAPHGRFVVVGGAGALESGGQRLLDSPDFPAEYLPESKAFAGILDDYRAATDLDWTMVAPSPDIAPGARTGSYATALDTPAGGFVSTQDFAVAIVDELEDPAHRGTRFTVASTDEDAARG